MRTRCTRLARRARSSALLFVLPVAFFVFAALASAVDVTIVSGLLRMTPSAGPLTLQGDRGFTFSAGVSAIGGIFVPYTTCNLAEGPCSPGDVVSLRAHWVGNDITGTATLGGVTYPRVGQNESMLVEFIGSFVLPPLAPSAQVVAPFAFTGMFTYSGGPQGLVGSGLATIALAPDAGLPGRWRIVEVHYEFADRAPAPWLGADVGFVGIPGSASHPDNAFVVNGAGGDIWGTADAFHFLYQSLPGAGSISARVVAQHNVHPFAKAGVMLRQSLDPASPSVILDVKPGGGIEFMVRYASGEPTIFIAPGAAVPPTGAFLRLQRTAGNQVSAFQSADGANWTLIASVTVPFTSTDLLAGLAVTSHDVSALDTALFDQVTVSGAPTSGNLLTEGDFEGYTPPMLGTPGWVSDDLLRQVAAKSETHQPRSGVKNGACWTPQSLDCGLYQEVTAPSAGAYTFRIHAAADRAGGLVGANVNGFPAASAGVEPLGFGVYAPYELSFIAAAGDVIRVWMYSPAQPGYVVVDDASLTPTAAPAN